VLVHGLQGHPRKTWTRRVPARHSTGIPAAVGSDEASKGQNSRRFSFPRRWNSGEKQSPKVDEIFWPADLLPFDCPTARIMTWGYDSLVSRFFGGAANKSHIFIYAKDLLYALGRERATCVSSSANRQD
jgi:ankyrin repeat domain-containing protein 50